MRSRRATRTLTTGLLLAAAGVALGALWAVRHKSASPPLKLAEELPTPPRVMPPSSSFGTEPQLTAAPHVASARWGGADDYEAISPEGLSSAFLSRATDSWLEQEDGQTAVEAELQGFQIATIEDLTVPELSDEPADFEIPDPYRRIKSAR